MRHASLDARFAVHSAIVDVRVARGAVASLRATGVVCADGYAGAVMAGAMLAVLAGASALVCRFDAAVFALVVPNLVGPDALPLGLAALPVAIVTAAPDAARWHEHARRYGSGGVVRKVFNDPASAARWAAWHGLALPRGLALRSRRAPAPPARPASDLCVGTR